MYKNVITYYIVYTWGCQKYSPNSQKVTATLSILRDPVKVWNDENFRCVIRRAQLCTGDEKNTFEMLWEKKMKYVSSVFDFFNYDIINLFFMILKMFKYDSI